MGAYTVDDICRFIGGDCRVLGNKAGKTFCNIRTIGEAAPNSLAFIGEDRSDKLELAMKTRAEIVICDQAFQATPQLLEQKCFVQVRTPRLAVLRIAQALKLLPEPPRGVHPSAVVHPQAQLGSNVYIGPNAYVGRSSIGDDSILYGNVHIYDNVAIGKAVTINAGAVIGAAGFGYLPNENGGLENFPHLGGVVVEDNVEIGANTCIARGALGNTVIGSGTKIDCLVHIAHNVHLGKNCMLISHSQIAGSVSIGDNCYIAPSATVSNVGSIGCNAFVGIGSVVISEVKENEKVFGNPARKYGMSERNVDAKS